MKKSIKNALALACAGLLYISAPCGMAVQATEQNVQAGGTQNSTFYDTLADLSIFDLSRYDNEKYLQYYWDSPVMYNESAMIVRNQDGSLNSVKLL
jgi:hypothetical protein